MGCILSHVLIRRSFKELNQYHTSMMDAIGNRFEGVVPSHGGTQRWAILLSYILLRIFFFVLRATFNGDIQSGDKWRVFNNPIPYWNLESLYPFPILFLRVWATCLLYFHWRWIMLSYLIQTKNRIIIPPFKIEFIVVNLPRSCPTPAANNNKTFDTIGSDKLDKCSCSHHT